MVTKLQRSSLVFQIPLRLIFLWHNSRSESGLFSTESCNYLVCLKPERYHLSKKFLAVYARCDPCRTEGLFLFSPSQSVSLHDRQDGAILLALSRIYHRNVPRKFGGVAPVCWRTSLYNLIFSGSEAVFWPKAWEVKRSYLASLKAIIPSKLILIVPGFHVQCTSHHCLQAHGENSNTLRSSCTVALSWDGQILVLNERKGLLWEHTECGSHGQRGEKKKIP